MSAQINYQATTFLAGSSCLFLAKKYFSLIKFWSILKILLKIIFKICFVYKQPQIIFFKIDVVVDSFLLLLIDGVVTSYVDLDFTDLFLILPWNQ